MSVQTEINRIKANISAAYTTASNMGATMPSSQNSASLADTISTIPSGGWPDTITPGDMPLLISANKVKVVSGAVGTYDTKISLTVPRAGTYRIKYIFSGDRNGSSNVAQLRVNGTTKHSTVCSGATTQVTGSVDLALAAGDVLKMYYSGQFTTAGFYAGPIIACIAFEGYEDFIS